MYRKGQKVCRIDWNKGTPYLQFGTVTKTTSRTFYVDNAKKPSRGWFAKAETAFAYEYIDLCRDWELFSKRRPADWTIWDTVTCVCRLRRLEHRMIRRKSKP